MGGEVLPGGDFLRSRLDFAKYRLGYRARSATSSASSLRAFGSRRDGFNGDNPASGLESLGAAPSEASHGEDASDSLTSRQRGFPHHRRSILRGGNRGGTSLGIVRDPFLSPLQAVHVLT
jgi:hypothetical protein